MDINKISDKNIEIIEIKYNQLISINKNIHLSKYIGCVSNCFNIIEGDLKKGIVMRYKKVDTHISRIEEPTVFASVRLIAVGSIHRGALPPLE